MSESATEHPASSNETQGTASRVNLVVLVGSSAAIIAITAWALISPDSADSALATLVGWATDWFGWFYVLLATSVLVFVIFIATSRFGRTKLGPEHSQPEFSTFAWASMLFAAGIGTDLMFFAVAEPVTQFLAPPTTEPGSVDAAREATVWTLFHYGITGWGMYALMGMALGYFAYRMGLPLAVRSALHPIFGRRVEGTLGDAVDLAAILGTIFGVATTLGIAVVQLNFGLNMLFDVPMGLSAQIALIVLGIAMATLSAVSGVNKGIKWLSQANVILALVLAAWILLTGRTSHLLNALVLNIGDFARRFPDMTMQTFAFNDTGTWMADWTLFFWAWWIAWASFVGLFLARISRGRTIRQFVAGTLIIPFMYILMWISIFGNASIDLIREGNVGFGELAMNVPEEGFYSMLAEYPAFTFIASIATFIGLLFYVTSADSGALVMANLSSRMRDVHADGPRWLRIFWATTTGALTIALLAIGGIATLQSATIIMGVPFAIVMVLVMIGLYKALRVEAFIADSRAGVMHGMLSGRSTHDRHGSGHWQARLRRVMSFPSPEKVDDFMHRVAEPALREVSHELTEAGVHASVGPITDEEGLPCIELTVEVSDAVPFRYRMSRREVPIPVYSGSLVPQGDDYYARLEVHLREGGQGYDVMGYTHGQIIDDVLDAYESHLEFLRLEDGTSL
ncbi:choline BCCT transporter BetT [Aeromicrobium sp. CTD01-1L150]|uniref:choline BCCT transporter BetT n=1 Tax=Aeromicrobium sp. CTD01-1L150 TaxID=3341830 RepID=UPI0035BED675